MLENVKKLAQRGWVDWYFEWIMPFLTISRISRPTAEGKFSGLQCMYRPPTEFGRINRVWSTAVAGKAVRELTLKLQPACQWAKIY